MSGEEWTSDERKVNRYLCRADGFPHRAEGESVLLEHVPRDARRILDLGTGDGRLLALLQLDRPEMVGVGLDFSELMLAGARKRFAADEHVELVGHDLAEPLPTLGRFDGVVSSFAIHHLEHERALALRRGVRLLLEVAGDGASRGRQAGLGEVLFGISLLIDRGTQARAGDRFASIG
jgi:tRNA (cmo5U34)-methyltransferase